VRRLEEDFNSCKVAFGILLIFFAGGFVSSGYGQTPPIIVGAAISLKEAFTEIGAAYKRQTGTEVTFSFGASGVLEKQIEEGAPIDVFASAAEKEMNDLKEKKLIVESTRADFVRNTLVLVVPADSKLELHSFPDLLKPGVTKVAIGNPKTVPAGQYAQELLRNTQMWPRLESRLILGENVRQVLDYVARGEVDAGIVYATDAQIAHGKAVIAARAPDNDYGPILFPLAVIEKSPHEQAARKFVDLVLSPEGAQILKKHGFEPVAKK
jgi:molybdate transport system substrate-binding protein